jgi:oligopeptidase B
MKHTSVTPSQLYREMKARVPAKELQQCYIEGEFVYQFQYPHNKEHERLIRWNLHLDPARQRHQVVVDGNELAEGHKHFSLGPICVSPVGDLVVYMVDYSGDNIYTAYVRNVNTGNVLTDCLTGLSGDIAWALDGKSFVYTEIDRVQMRAIKVLHHRLGDLQHCDTCLLYEADDEFNCSVFASQSGDVIFVGSVHQLQSEWYSVDARNPLALKMLLRKREPGVEYYPEHHRELGIVVRTNWKSCDNYTIVTGTDWETTVVPHRVDVLLTDFVCFAKYLVVDERSGGLPRVRIMRWDNLNESIDVLLGTEEAYSMHVSFRNHQYDATFVRVFYSSPCMPDSWWDVQLSTGQSQLVLREHIKGGHDPKRYTTRFLFVNVRDGTRVPVVLVHHVECPPSANSPLFVTGYSA